MIEPLNKGTMPVSDSGAAPNSTLFINQNLKNYEKY